MSRRLSQISLVLVILLSSAVWALGLGEIKLDSALNEPLRAEIELLSATPDELNGLQIALASADTFVRYGLDRPLYLQDMEFQILRSGSEFGNVIEIRSAVPVTEPFLTFLIEASWSRGRLLREYTVLLDPPTFAPAAMTQSTPAVTAPTRSDPADSGRIERPARDDSPPRQEPRQETRQEPEPSYESPRRDEPRDESPPVIDDSPYDRVAGDDYFVPRGETLWSITARVRPDSRLTMNQTMLAIFEANPDSFGGNINVMREGTSLRIPSADEIFQITRGEALDEVLRQHAAWDPGYSRAPVADDTTSQPNLTLVPPDEEYVDDYLDDTAGLDDEFGDEALSREQEIEQRIADLEAADVPEQRSLIEIRDNELAALREELANIRGEEYVPVVDDEITDEIPVEDDSVIADDAVADDTDATDEPTSTAQPPSRSEPGLVERILDALASWWMWIAGALVVIGGALFWFMRRGDEKGDEPEAWQALDADEESIDALSATGTMQAPGIDESIVVVEQESAIRDLDATVDAPAPDFSPISDPAPEPEPTPEPEPIAEPELEQTAEIASVVEIGDTIEDTFSSETAINLDQTDPMAEADFHMAYGLYDQAADLVNGALSVEPERQDLLSKLCEIYFVLGNRDAFIDAAGRLKTAVAGGESAEWDKIVIMGQQIAADDEMFAGAGAPMATKAVDMSFEAEMDDAGSLDMEFIAESESESADDVFDIGGADEGEYGESTDFDVTAEMPTMESTLESPTVEEQFDVISGTAELPSIDETLGNAIETSGLSADATAEIDLDDLGLDLDGLDENEVASLDDLDATAEVPAVDQTGINELLDDLDDITGTNLEADPESTGFHPALKGDQTGTNIEADSESTAFHAALKGDETGINESLPDPDATHIAPDIATDVGIDSNLLDATGVTQILSEDFTVDTLSDIAGQIADNEATMLASMGDDEADADAVLGDEEKTMLAGLDDDEGDEADFDFARTEALPSDAFGSMSNLDETGELPVATGTDVDLDLDDLTAALQVSEVGDTIQQMRDDATIEQPRPDISEMGEEDDFSPTMNLEPGEISDDLHDARTMTEVGTKLDLARAYVDMGDPAGARSILEEVVDEGDDAQRQQAQQLLDSLAT